mmetsp:Transcript_1182/g.2384  ORF Transcript_1182/g.2384 Transcript_1182/m.2384 type:complete len:222 (+) Transcript_1182:1940-2605(+)
MGVLVASASLTLFAPIVPRTGSDAFSGGNLSPPPLMVLLSPPEPALTHEGVSILVSRFGAGVVPLYSIFMADGTYPFWSPFSPPRMRRFASANSASDRAPASALDRSSRRRRNSSRLFWIIPSRFSPRETIEDDEALRWGGWTATVRRLWAEEGTANRWGKSDDDRFGEGYMAFATSPGTVGSAGVDGRLGGGVCRVLIIIGGNDIVQCGRARGDRYSVGQ